MLEPREGIVALPRFEFDSGFVLQGAFSALGMPIAFDEREANFDGIASLEELDGNLYIDDVYPDTFIGVDEGERRPPRRRASSSRRNPPQPILSR